MGPREVNMPDKSKQSDPVDQEIAGLLHQQIWETLPEDQEAELKGKIEEAEAYMEQRRQFFWENGYLIRKLNQAYFAFHGAYNASPSSGGAAGQDPVGPAVQSLRSQSDSLAQFLRQISRVTSFDQLQKLLE